MRLFACAAVLFCAPVRAAESPADVPVASFEVIDGWIEFKVERDGKPVTGARVTVLVGATVWATGETGPEGRGTFPVPRGGSCQLTFEFGAGPSAPVPLSVLDDKTVVPNRAPVYDGTAQCCVVPPKTPRPPEERSLLAGPLGVAFAVFVLNALFVGWLWWRLRPAGRSPHRRSDT